MKTNTYYTAFRETVNLEYGLDGRNSAGIARACISYQEEHAEKREVIITNLSDETKPEANGTSPIKLLCLGAPKGSLLEIKVEGTDDSAKKFCDVLRRTLTREVGFYGTGKTGN